MTARAPLWTAALGLLLAGPALAQSRQGVYRVQGDEPGRGAYAGQVELRWTGPGYAFVREVEYSTWRYTGRPVSCVWSGVARDVAGGGVEVELRLDRMGWASAGAGLAPRTAADGAPMLVRGAFTPQPGGLAGAFAGQGAPFVDPTETWTLVRAPGAAPIWAPERVVTPTHRPPSPLVRRLVDLLFASYHRTPWVAPYVNRPEFRAGVTSAVHDRTDAALHRARPDLLRVLQRIADPLNLEEARAKADAFGKTLRAKAEAADLEIPARFVDPTGALHRREGGVRDDDGDGCLWTGVYAYAQALRLQATGDPVAALNIERTARALLLHMQITGRPDVFARTLRTATGTAGGSWHAGAGPFAGIEWLETGNNDMLKGLLLGALALAEGLPGQGALRAEYAQALEALTAAHDTMKGARRASNRTLGNGLVALLQGGAGPARDRYRRLARNPFSLLIDLASGGGITYQGQADWSGTHLEICGLIMQTRTAHDLGERFVESVHRLTLRRAHARLSPARRSLHSIAAAALGGLARPDVEDAVWHLREMPFPRARLATHHAWREDFCVSPWPNLPWKRDWTTNRGRSLGLVHPPAFERDIGNYLWKEVPAPNVDGGGSTTAECHATDYLFPYWLARAHGVIGPNE